MPHACGAVAAGLHVPSAARCNVCALPAAVSTLQVHTSTAVCSHAGTLVAFDRFLNLVLRDVEEEYTVLLRVKRVLPARGFVAPTPLHAAQSSEQHGLSTAAEPVAGAAATDDAMSSPGDGADDAQRMPAEGAATGADEATPRVHADVRTPSQSAAWVTTEPASQEPPHTAFPELNSHGAEEDEQLLVFRSDWRPRQPGAETFASPGKGSERSLASGLTDSSAGRPSPVPPGSVQSLASALTTDSDSDEAPGGPAAEGDAATKSMDADDDSAEAAQHADAALLYAESFRARAGAAQLSSREEGQTASKQGPGADADGAVMHPGGAADGGGGAEPRVDQRLANSPGGMESSAKSSGERVRWVRKQDHRRRKLRQVFVCGDSVVLVSLVEISAAAHPLPADV